MSWAMTSGEWSANSSAVRTPVATAMDLMPLAWAARMSLMWSPIKRDGGFAVDPALGSGLPDG